MSMTNKPKKPLWVIGIDEVGRGPLAGPVTVCAVAVPYKHYKKELYPGLTDSKQMTPKNRERIYLDIQCLKERFGIQYACASRTASVIDSKGIAASIRACIKTTLKKLALDPEECLVLLDGGLKAPLEYVRQKTIIKGDTSEPVISLASVIAKVMRDAVMVRLHKKYPHFNWKTNKGYGTLAHRIALTIHGTSPLHRATFLRRILLTNSQ